MNGRAIKWAIEKGYVKLLLGIPAIDQSLSASKKTSLTRDLDICRKFLKGAMVIKLAKDYQVTHQRISQMVDHGLKYMISSGHLINERNE